MYLPCPGEDVPYDRVFLQERFDFSTPPTGGVESLLFPRHVRTRPWTKVKVVTLNIVVESMVAFHEG
jgi:hypothetical protein